MRINCLVITALINNCQIGFIYRNNYMKRSQNILLALIIGTLTAWSQKPFELEVYKNTPVNFSNEGSIEGVYRLQSGRLLIKKVTAPNFKKGTDVRIDVTVRSNGDPWDKSGSAFVISNTDLINVLTVAQGLKSFPMNSGIEGDYLGIRTTENYQPAVELMRFMTPFGVGFFSDEVKNPRMRYNRPVYVPKWEAEVSWSQDISQLESLVTGTFYVGVWIDTWTAEGYTVDVSLHYSGRARKQEKVIAILNTVYYANGQKIPDVFAKSTVESSFVLPKDAKNVKLHYISTGHGGHSGGDEFIQLRNTAKIDGNKVIDFIPWRDDCASFRRFNPSSGVWTRKDTAFAYTKERVREYKPIEERLASSDLSRSNWCPGSQVFPEVVSLGDLKKGKHLLEVQIPATSNTGDQLNHWLVSAYVTYDE